ncbi:MAG: hypothetical protein ACXWNQ_06505, partial [Anaerolineales bacterium]
VVDLPKRSCPDGHMPLTPSSYRASAAAAPAYWNIPVVEEFFRRAMVCASSWRHRREVFRSDPGAAGFGRGGIGTVHSETAGSAGGK